MQKVSCVIPVYNEAKRMGNMLGVAKKARDQGLISEFIVVSDGSTDDSAKIAEDFGADKVIVLPKNVGKGGAVLEGVRKANFGIILMLDADLQGITVQHIRNIIEPIEHHDADLVIGYLAEDSWQIVLPQFSGQRAFKKSPFEKMFKSEKLKNSKYSLEILMVRFANKSKLKTLYVPLSGLSHVKREKKMGFDEDAQDPTWIFLSHRLYL